MWEKPVTILVIDDDKDDIVLFIEATKDISNSIICLVSFDCEQALTELRNMIEPPDIIFLDVNMPGIGGKKCLTEIKADEKLRVIPIVMHSTWIDEDDRIFFSKSNAHCLQKATNFKSLVSGIKELLIKHT